MQMTSAAYASALPQSMDPSFLLGYLRHAAARPNGNHLPAHLAPLAAAVEPVLKAANAAKARAALERCYPGVFRALKEAQGGTAESSPQSDPNTWEPNQKLIFALGEGEAHRVVELMKAVDSLGVRLTKVLADASSGVLSDLAVRAIQATPAALRSGRPVPLRLVESKITMAKGASALVSVFAATVHEIELGGWLTDILISQLEDAVEEAAWFFATIGYPAGVDFERPIADLRALFTEAESDFAAFDEKSKSVLTA